MASSHDPSSSHHSNGGYEVRDVRLRPIVMAGIGLIVATLLVLAGMKTLERSLNSREEALSPPANPLAESHGRELPPEPRLQTHPLQDLHALREHEAAILTSYDWVDRQAGTIRIPITRAMDVLADRGLPARKEESK